MSQPQFINIQATTTTGQLGALTRSLLLVTRETVTGFTPNAKTGLYKINSTDVSTFNTDNPFSFGLKNTLLCVFDQTPSYDYVYILSTNGVALTSAMLDKANRNPRDWTFATIVSQYQGGGNSGSDSATYFADLLTLGTWAVPVLDKIVVNTFSIEEVGNNPVVLPAPLLLGGSISSLSSVKTVVSNSQHTDSDASYVTVYDNVIAAVVAYCINSAVARSWGSLSDAHDFAYIMSDTYSAASQSVIANNSLAQYNGAKDRAESLFFYDTQMNDKQNPPLTKQIESVASEVFIKDYVYVYVHNALQAAGQTGLPTDNLGIQAVYGLTNQALQNCADLNLILRKDNGLPDYTLSALTAEQVTVLSPNWKTTGIWPAGVISGKVALFAADHYITLNFAF